MQIQTKLSWGRMFVTEHSLVCTPTSWSLSCLSLLLTRRELCCLKMLWKRFCHWCIFRILAWTRLMSYTGRCTFGLACSVTLNKWYRSVNHVTYIGRPSQPTIASKIMSNWLFEDFAKHTKAVSMAMSSTSSGANKRALNKASAIRWLLPGTQVTVKLYSINFSRILWSLGFPMSKSSFLKNPSKGLWSVTKLKEGAPFK